MDLAVLLFAFFHLIYLSFFSCYFIFNNFTYFLIGLIVMMTNVTLLHVYHYLFFYWVKSYLKKLTPQQYRLSKMISSHCSKGEHVITFVKTNNIWSCKMFDESVDFNLKCWAFKKAFLNAFIIRAIRYPIISNKLPVKKLGNFVLSGMNKKQTIKIKYYNKTTVKEKLVVKNGKSFCGFFEWRIINVSDYVTIFQSKFVNWRNRIMKIDEKKFCDITWKLE